MEKTDSKSISDPVCKLFSGKSQPTPIFHVTKRLSLALYCESSNSSQFFEISMTRSDLYYLKRCLDGHPDEYRFLIGRYKSVLMAHLTGKLGNRSLAEEAAQETFVRAYFGLPRLKKRKSFYPWLLGIGNRVAQEQLRAAKKFTNGDCVEHQEARPEINSDRPELEHAIAQLSDSNREVVLLKYYADHSCSQISEKLDIPIASVTKRLSRAYSQLRQLLKCENEVQK
jgi:RNA polymerase sigma-70 factor, ECF subfamily